MKRTLITTTIATATLALTASASVAAPAPKDVASAIRNERTQTLRGLTTAARIPSARGSTELQEVLDTMHRAGAVGVVAAAQNHRGERRDGQWAGASGDRVLKGPKGRPGDRFRVGSITKPMVATVMLKLVEQGRLSLHTRVDDVLPGLLGAHGRQVTLEQLLSHRSGLPDYLQALAEEKRNVSVQALATRTITPRQMVQTALRTKWLFTPGDRTSYSNTNYIVAGMMASKVTGRSVDSLVRDWVFRPAGMGDSTFPTNTAFPTPHLTEYVDTGRGMQRLNSGASVFGAAGAVVSTTGDLNRFWRSLFTGRLLKRSTVNTMVKPRGKLSPTVGYGLGVFSIRMVCGAHPETVYGHDGATFGTFSIALSTRDGRAQSSASLTGRSYTPAGILKQVSPALAAAPAMGYACAR